MAIIVGGPSYGISGEDLGRFAGFQYQGPQQQALYDLFEQAFRNDPYRLSAGIDIEPYLQGINLNDPVLAGDFSNPQKMAASQQAANQILSRMSAAGVGPSGWTPWGGYQDFNVRQNARGGGFTEGGGLFDFIGDIPGELVRVGGELASEPGVQALGLAAGAGALMGGAAGAAGAPGISGAPATPLFSTPASTGTNLFGGTFSTPAMTTYAGPGGTSLGGFAAPAALDASVAGLATAAPTAAGSSGGSISGPATGGAATAGPAWLGEKAIAGLSNPIVLGALGGGLLGGLSGSGTKEGTITVEEGIPDWLMPYAKPALDKYSTDIQNYQVDPYGIMPSAMQEFQRTINGQYLDPSSNKWLPEYFRLGAERVKGSLSPSFGHMQAFGQHSGYNEALSRGLSDLAVGLYGGAYEKERDRQAMFTGNAPGFLTGASTSAFAPYGQYLSTVGSLGKKKDEPFFTNPWSGVLGGALSGGTLGWMFGNPGKK